jgi:endonuclease YncB( thermonuclease family)
VAVRRTGAVIKQPPAASIPDPAASRTLTTFAAASLAFACVIGTVDAAPSRTVSGSVTRVEDGNTFFVGTQRVVLFGAEAPALAQQCRADAIVAPGPSACIPCGQMSRDALAGLLGGKAVHCVARAIVRDGIVGECTAGGIHVGAWMLSNGWAVGDPERLTKADRREYLGAESGAKRANAGLWSTTFIPPATWKGRGLRLACEKDATR